MPAVLAFAALAFGAGLVALAFLGLLLKLAFRLLFFPLLLLKWIVTLLVMIVVGPVLAIVGLALAVAFGLVLAVPLLPVIALGAILWLIVSASRRPAAV